MKKLVYILSLAIGLLMTGCAQWETMESLPRDTWGPAPELTIEVAPLDSVTGQLISDEMDVVFYIKNATLFHFVYAEGPEEEINYTDLLKGMYGGYSAEPNVEGDTLGITLPGFVPGNTYTVYAVAANEAGVQTTATVTVGAVDVTAPVITSSAAEPLRAAAKGKQVTVAFSENIVRTDDMPAVTYEVFEYIDGYVSYNSGNASAMASGTNLVVTLPTDFEFKAETLSVILLSFPEGAVEDKYGNKMAALVNGFDEEELPNGPWWMVDNTINDDPQDPTAFFQEGTYNFDIVFTQQGKQYGGKLPVTFSKVNDAFDLTKLFGEQSPTATAIEWSVEGLLTGLYGTDGVRDLPFPALTYEYDYEGAHYQEAFMIDYASQEQFTVIGQLDWFDDGNYIDVVLGFVDGDYIASYWQFVLADENGNTDAPVEDLMGVYVNKTAPCFFAYGNLAGEGENWYRIMQFDQLILTKDGNVEAVGAKKFDKPVKVELAGEPMSFSGISTNFNR